MASGAPLLNRLEPYTAPDGEARWLLTSKVPIPATDGAVAGILGVGRDVTDLQRAEQELRAAKNAAEATSRLKTEFLATVSHELRTPMTSVRGYVELMLDGATGPLDAKQRAFLDVVARNARRLTGLLNDVLDLAKIDAGRMDVRCAPVDLAAAVAQVRAELAPQAAAKGVELIVMADDGLPCALADPDRLHQILVNLVGNALKFTERGAVTISAWAEGERLAIAVADTGIGIAPEHLELIFDEYRQADDGATRRFGGTGLGLAIARKLAAAQGGEIAVASVLGAGSTFTLLLPLAAAPDPRG